MVLFNDTQPPKPPTVFSKCLKWVFRLVLVAMALILLIIGCLNLLQGNGETQKRGIERSIQGFTGKTTNITELKIFQLFPELHIAMKGVHSGLFSKEKIRVYDFDIRAPGISIFKQDGTFRDINIQDISFSKDNAIVRAITSVRVIDEAGLQNTSAPHLLIEVSEPSPLQIQLGLDIIGANVQGNRDYRLKPSFPFSITLDQGTLSGHILDGGFITGTAALSKSHFGLPAGDIECFFGKLSFEQQSINISNLWVKTQSSNLVQIPSVHVPAFSQTYREDVSSPTPAPEIKNSTCAAFMEEND